MMKSTCSVALSVMLAAAGASAGVSDTIELFGTEYRVDRFDYAEALQIPDPIFGGTIPLLESESITFIGDNEFLVGTDEGGNFLTIANFVVKARIDEGDDGFPTGISFVCTVIENDASIDGWPLDPSGLTINTGNTGIGAGGGLVVAEAEDEDGGQFLRDFGTAFQSCTLGEQFEFPAGSGCLDDNNGQLCGILAQPNTGDMEDVAYIPGLDEFWLVDEDGPDIDRYTTGGDYLSSFPAGFANSDFEGDIKGIAFVADNADAPADLQGLGGAVIVSIDGGGSGLQTFDLSGNLLSNTPITEGGAADGESLLDLTGCSEQITIEGLAYDSQTGRILLLNQGDFTDCNFLYVLSPLAGPQDTSGIGLSEIMYNPASTSDNDWEYVEIFNSGDTDVDLAGFVLDDDDSSPLVEANIAAGTLAAGGTAVLFDAEDNSVEAMTAAWGEGINFVGVTDWPDFANGGDVVALWDSLASYGEADFGNAVFTVEYDDSKPWPSDDGSASIALADIALDPTDGANWQLSTDGVNGAYFSNEAGDNGAVNVGSPGVLPPAVVCDGDANGDLMVDSADLNAVLGNFGTASGATLGQGDVTGDGAVDSADLNVVLGLFGTSCI